MNISEEEKKQILSKYKNDTSEEVLNYLKRNFVTTKTSLDWMPEPIRMIIIGDKTYIIKGNKKFLVSKISSIIDDIFIGVNEKILRRTIKKFLDGISL